MKKLMIVVGVSCVVAVLSAAVPEVGNVTMIQPPGTRTVTITYTLVNAPAVVTLDIETNVTDGVWASIGADNFQHVYGDVNKLVSGKETYTITWLARRDWPNREIANGGIRAKLTAWAPDHTPDYMVVDLLAAPGDNVHYYASTNFLPGGLLSNPIYRTTSIVMRRIDAKNVAWTMGSSPLESNHAANEATHEVTLTNDYYIGVFELTQKQWTTVWGSNPSSRRRDMRPVENVSYNIVRVSAGDTATASDYAQYDWPNPPYDNSFLGKLRTLTQVDFDLPSEAQWEFAAKAGFQAGCEVWKNGAFDDGTPLTDANLARLGRTKVNNEADGNSLYTADVGSYEPNAWGLYDIYGNVIEWCLDWYAADITGLGGAVKTGVEDLHARKGGAYNNPIKYQRLASRGGNEPGFHTGGAVGFRLSCRAGLQ